MYLYCWLTTTVTCFEEFLLLMSVGAVYWTVSFCEVYLVYKMLQYIVLLLDTLRCCHCI